MTKQKENGLIGRDWLITKDKRRFVEFEIPDVGRTRIRIIAKGDEDAL